MASYDKVKLVVVGDSGELIWMNFSNQNCFLNLHIITKLLNEDIIDQYDCEQELGICNLYNVFG